MVSAISLQNLDDRIKLGFVCRCVRVDVYGISMPLGQQQGKRTNAKPDGHVHFGVLDSLKNEGRLVTVCTVETDSGCEL